MHKQDLMEEPLIKVASKIINTRFGDIVFDKEKTIFFPYGLVGIPYCKKFLLSHYPNEKMKNYFLLQSLEDENLCFLTISFESEFLALEKKLISSYDIKAALNQYNITHKNFLILLIATIHNNGLDNSKISINLKAPLLIDSQNLQGYQHIFIKSEYQIKHFLN